MRPEFFGGMAIAILIITLGLLFADALQNADERKADAGAIARERCSDVPGRDYDGCRNRVFDEVYKR